MDLYASKCTVNHYSLNKVKWEIKRNEYGKGKELESMDTFRLIFSYLNAASTQNYTGIYFKPHKWIFFYEILPTI